MFLKSLFYLRRSDRIALLVLLSFIFICVILLFVLSDTVNITSNNGKDSLDHKNMSMMTQNDELSPKTTQDKKQLFNFDPNTATAEELDALGLASYQIRNIMKYRAKGGIFHSPMDFAKLYGLTRKQFRELEPYIVISDDYLPASTLSSVQAYIEHKKADKEAAHEVYEQFKKDNAYQPYQVHERDTIKYPKKLKVGEKINLALADTNMLKKVPGIGSGRARYILNYGKRLGGYVHVGQLLEIEDFPEESIIYFTINSAHTDKINLNTATLSQMKRHPYINFYQAKSICDFRRLKGKITSLSQLRLIKDFTADDLERIKPYVDF